MNISKEMLNLKSVRLEAILFFILMCVSYEIMLKPLSLELGDGVIQPLKLFKD